MGRINEWITLRNDARCVASPLLGSPLGSEVSCRKGWATEKKIPLTANRVNPCQKIQKVGLWPHSVCCLPEGSVIKTLQILHWMAISRRSYLQQTQNDCRMFDWSHAKKKRANVAKRLPTLFILLFYLSTFYYVNDWICYSWYCSNLFRNRSLGYKPKSIYPLSSWTRCAPVQGHG